MGTNHALKEITTAKKPYQHFPSVEHLAELTALLHYKAAFAYRARLSQELQQSEGRLKRRAVMFKKGNFTSLILLFSWIDLNVQIPLQCTEFVVFIENRNMFTDLTQTSANGIWWELEGGL